MLVELQYLRAFAALMVVYFHSVLQLENLGLDGIHGLPLFGESGVDLFFVLSGFVMWHTTSGRDIQPVDFYKRRIVRIVPLYWTLTLAAAAIALLAPSLLKSTRFDMAHLGASLSFIPWINPANAKGMIAPVIVPGWTLNFEMYFYLIFGIVLMMPERLRILALCLAIGGLTLLWHVLPGSTAASFYGNPIVFEFVAGVILAQAWQKGLLLPRGMAYGGLFLGLAAILWSDSLHLVSWRFVTMGLPATLIIWSMLSLDWRRMRIWRRFAALGDASYSLYLTHVFVLAGTRVLFLHLPEATRHPHVFVTVCLALSVAVALAVHRLYEAPIDAWLRAVLRKRPREGHSSTLNTLPNDVA